MRTDYRILWEYRKPWYDKRVYEFNPETPKSKSALLLQAGAGTSDGPAAMENHSFPKRDKVESANSISFRKYK